MKTYITLALIFLFQAAHAQTMHLDLQALGTSRLRGYASAGLVYRSYSGFETSANASVEIGHNQTLSAYAGYRLYTTTNDHADGLVVFGGLGYTWHWNEAKAEIGGNRMYPVVGLKYIENYGIMEVKYVANTIAISFGYRLFNHKQ